MTFALFTRAQALCREQLRISPLPSQTALIPYAWHLVFSLVFYEAYENPRRAINSHQQQVESITAPIVIYYILPYNQRQEKKRPEGRFLAPP